MLTVVKKRRDHKLQVESYGVFRVAAVLMREAQVQCTWKFDALTNSRWWRIFVKVEFVRVVSNIVYKVGYSWTCSCIVFR